MVSPGGSVDKKIGLVSSINLGGQLLGLLDHSAGLLKGVHLVEACQVDGKDAGPDKFPKARGNSLSALVAGSMEGDLSAFRKGNHCVEKRGFALVHGESDRLVVGEDGVVVLNDEVGAVESRTDMSGKPKNSLMGQSVIEAQIRESSLGQNPVDDLTAHGEGVDTF